MHAWVEPTRTEKEVIEKVSEVEKKTYRMQYHVKYILGMGKYWCAFLWIFFIRVILYMCGWICVFPIHCVDFFLFTLLFTRTTNLKHCKQISNKRCQHKVATRHLMFTKKNVNVILSIILYIYNKLRKIDARDILLLLQTGWECMNYCVKNEENWICLNFITLPKNGWIYYPL